MRKQILMIAFFVTVSLGLCRHVYGLGNKESHPALTKKAVEASNPACVIDDYLKTQLDLVDGIETKLHWDFRADIKKRLERGKAKPGCPELLKGTLQ